MRVPLEWLKQYVDVEATAEEVGVRLTMGGLEVEGIEESALGPVLDVYVTPNRGDCLSILGVAREIAALYNLPLKMPQPPPSVQGGEVAQRTAVTIEDPELCPRYAARLLQGVQIGPSPEWMQARLEAAGMRPLSNVVDVTNYVMLELGQPLHAFDFDKLAGQRIVVRRAYEGETLETLDGETRTLTPAMLVIADAKKPVAVAGVMGGAASEVSDTTTNLLLESAHFHPLSVRRTSRALSLRTEASYRFERIVDPEGVRRAVDRACELLAQMGQPEALPGVVDIYPQPVEAREVTLRVSRAVELLGIPEITQEIATDCLQRLGLEIEAANEDLLRVRVPALRPDLTLEEDLIEEIGRIYGYENIPETLPLGVTTRGGDSSEGAYLSRIRRLLVECGLQEVITHSLSAPSFFDAVDDAVQRVPIRNAMSAEVSGLRRSLLPTLLDVAEHNVARGQQALALFEIGRVWRSEEGEPVESLAVAGLLVGSLSVAGWQRDARPIPADFATARGILERLYEGLGLPEPGFAPPAEATQVGTFHPGRVALFGLEGRETGIVGELHPRCVDATGLRDRIYVFEISLEALRPLISEEGVRYRPLSRYPAMARDLAPRLAENVPYRAVEEAVYAAEVELLEEFRLADVFRGLPLPEGTKSLTLSFTFRSGTGTLTDVDVNEALKSIRTELEVRCGATFVG